MSVSVVSPVFIDRQHEMASLAAPMRRAEGGAEGLPLAPLADAVRALARMTPAGELGELPGPAGSGLPRLTGELGDIATDLVLYADTLPLLDGHFVGTSWRLTLTAADGSLPIPMR